MGHCGDVPQANLLPLNGKKLNLTQQKHAFTNQKKYTTTQNKHKKLKPGLVACYDIRPGIGNGIFLFQRFLYKSVAYLLTWTLTHSITALRPTRGGCLSDTKQTLYC